MNHDHADVLIVGAGFTGLSAGLTLARAGKRVHIIEREQHPGGLGGNFDFPDGSTVEKFYHHLFLSDHFVVNLAQTLGLGERLLQLPSMTGMYYNKSVWRLTTPLDLLKFRPLPFLDRIRLGLVVLGVRFLRDWRSIEGKSVREWLEPLCGKRAYEIVWAPLIDSKFSTFAEVVNAVWFWKKLVLRGGTRGKGGEERLLYFRGGFGELARSVANEIIKLGGRVDYGVKAIKATVAASGVVELQTNRGAVSAKRYLLTQAFPVVANILEECQEHEWLNSLRRIKYLGNICLALSLTRPLSETYWINVNEPGFPFVGVIEHTNLDTSDSYHGRHIVYLSRYIDVSRPEWSYSDEAYFQYAVPYLKRMFPEFQESWISDYSVWREEHAQPIAERNYSQFVPKTKGPLTNLWVANMAQIYPEDRGINYSVRDGEAVGKQIIDSLQVQ